MSLPLPILNYWERRLSAAQSRYLRACQALAQTRKLVRKEYIQLIAKRGSQQLNVVAPLPFDLDFPPKDQPPHYKDILALS